MADVLVEEFSSSLDDLTFNSKPLINMLTMLADDNVQHAALIVQVIEARIHKAKPSEKLPAVYLLDSIIKNISTSNYTELFSKNLVDMFCGVFEKVDEKTRQAMWKLRQTWVDIIANKKLYKLDLRIQRIDPAWPITAEVVEEPVSSIHVNPKFLIKAEAEAQAKREQEEQEALMRQQLLAKQQELLKLQQERLELELAEAKARLDSQVRQTDTQSAELPTRPAVHGPSKVCPEPTVEVTSVSGAGSTVNIPTIAVQGVIRDPRSPPKDPRIATCAIRASNSPTKDVAAAMPLPAKSGASATTKIPTVPQVGAVTATPSETVNEPKSVSSSQSAGLATHKTPRERDERSKAKEPRSSKEQTSSNKSSASKNLSPLKGRGDKKTTDDKKAVSSADRHVSDGRNNRNKTSAPSSSGSRSSRSYHRTNSRSASPEKEKKFVPPRSRSRSPRRSPRGLSAESKKSARARELTIHIRDVDKRPRSPDTDVVIVDSDESKREPQRDDLSEPPAKKVKPVEELDRILPADFRELFGNEDQDYRCLPTSNFSKTLMTPPTPGTPSSGRWAAFKAERPEEFPFQQPRATLEMPSPSSSPFHDVDMRSPPVRRMSTPLPSRNVLPPLPPITRDQLSNIDIPAGLMLEQLDSILSEADTQLRTGRLSHEQHQAILKQLGELQKLQKLKLQLSTQVSGDKDQRVEQPPPRSVKEPFPAQPHSPTRRTPMESRAQLCFEESRPAHDSDDRTLPPPSPQLAEGAACATIPDQDLRDKTTPLPKPPMPPMMRPPLPPLLSGSRPRRPSCLPPRRVSLGQANSYKLPYDTDKYYIPKHDPRWLTQKNDGSRHKLYIDERAYELPLGCPPRQIMLGSSPVQISVDSLSRGIKVDGVCYYKIGDMPRKVTINGITCMIMYRGPERKVWIDDMAHEVYTDGPPQSIYISEKEHLINIDTIMNQVIIDGQVVCPFGGPKKAIEIGYHKHELQFEPPPRKILIDGKLCEMNFKGKYPCVNIEGQDYGIRFDGPPREVRVDGVPWTLEMAIPRKIKIKGRIHMIAFGGPGHEVVINGQWYDVKFNGAAKVIRLGMSQVEIMLVGGPPEVKILGEVVSDPRKIEELVGKAFIDPTIVVMSSPSRPPLEMPRPPMPPVQLDIPPPPMPRPPMPPVAIDLPPQPLAPRDALVAPDVLQPAMPAPPIAPDGLRLAMPAPSIAPDGLRPAMPAPPIAPDGLRPAMPSPPIVPDGLRPAMPAPLIAPDGLRPPMPAPIAPDGLPPVMTAPVALDTLSPVMTAPIAPDGLRPGMPAPIAPEVRPHVMPPMMPMSGPPRGGYHDSSHLRGSIPLQFEDHGRNSPNRDDFGPPMHNLDPDRPPQPLHHRDGPRHNFHRDGPRAHFAGPPQRVYRGGPPPRMRGNRGGPGGRGGYRDDFYPPPRHGMRGGPPRMHGPYNGPAHHDVYFNRPPLPLPSPPYGPLPPPMPPLIPPPVFASQIDVNDLFGKLVSSGIIKKAEEPAPTPLLTAITTNPTQVEAKSAEAAQPGPNEKPKDKEVKPPVKPAVISKLKEKLPEVPDMTDFNLDNMKIRCQTVIQRMYGGIQCSSCGVRFITEDMDKYREHLDWHFRQNRRNQDGVKVAKFRQWYYTTNEWIQFEEIGDLEERGHSMYFEKLLQTQALPGSTGALQAPEAPISCPAATGNTNEDVCGMCGEQFENFFDEDAEAWCLRDAVRVGDKTYHPACYEDVGETSMFDITTTEEEMQTPTPDEKMETLTPEDEIGMTIPEGEMLNTDQEMESSTTDEKLKTETPEGELDTPTSELEKEPSTTEGEKVAPNTECEMKTPTQGGETKTPASEAEVKTPASGPEVKTSTSVGEIKTPTSGCEIKMLTPKVQLKTETPESAMKTPNAQGEIKTLNPEGKVKSLAPEVKMQTDPTPDGKTDKDSVANPLAFLSQLTVTNPKLTDGTPDKEDVPLTAKVEPTSNDSHTSTPTMPTICEVPQVKPEPIPNVKNEVSTEPVTLEPTEKDETKETTAASTS